MKQIKLQVGKTYLSRNGSEVTIVGNNDRAEYPCTGNNGQWYTESGRFDISVAESECDLIEEVPSETTRHTFKIPGGVKELTVEQVGNRIVVEMVPEKGPKPGDVCINDVGSVYIFKEVSGAGNHKHYAWLWRDGGLTYNSVATPGRPATTEEAQPLFDALKKAGKRWNPETMQVEDVPERERIMDFLQRYGNNVKWSHEQLCWLVESYLTRKEYKKG